MNEEEIKKLAREYAYHCLPPEDWWEDEMEGYERVIDEIVNDNILPMFQWLLKDYCIVPKSDMNELIVENRDYKGYKSLTENFPEDLIPERTEWNTIRDYADGLYYLIEDLLSLFDYEH